MWLFRKKPIKTDPSCVYELSELSSLIKRFCGLEKNLGDMEWGDFEGSDLIGTDEILVGFLISFIEVFWKARHNREWCAPEGGKALIRLSRAIDNHINGSISFPKDDKEFRKMILEILYGKERDAIDIDIIENSKQIKDHSTPILGKQRDQCTYELDEISALIKQFVTEIKSKDLRAWEAFWSWKPKDVNRQLNEVGLRIHWWVGIIEICFPENYNSMLTRDWMGLPKTQHWYNKAGYDALLRLSQVIDVGIKNGGTFPYDDNETNAKMLKFLLMENAKDLPKSNN